MKIAIIGRTEILYETALLLREAGHEIVAILTAREAPEYTRTTQDFKLLAKDWEIPFAQGHNVSEHLDMLSASSPDIGVSMNYTGILPQSVIDLFPLGVLNAHGGDLPRYRGNACQAWAILNAEEKIGLCVHKMNGDEIDSGDIITRDHFPINQDTKVTEVWAWMLKRVPVLMKDAVRRLSVDPDFVLQIQSEDPNEILRCYPRLPEDGRITWTNPAIEILRLINASNKPYRGAYCEFEGQKIIIWDADLLMDQECHCAVPGQVTAVHNDFVEVSCGEGKLCVKKVQIDEKVLSPGQIIKSTRKRLS